MPELSAILVSPLVRQFMQDRAPGLTAQPLIEALSRLSEQDRRAISRGLRLLRKAFEPTGEGA